MFRSIGHTSQKVIQLFLGAVRNLLKMAILAGELGVSRVVLEINSAKTLGQPPYYEQMA
jgi:hypothetical protein